jgi:hypothetical protein
MVGFRFRSIRKFNASLFLSWVGKVTLLMYSTEKISNTSYGQFCAVTVVIPRIPVFDFENYVSVLIADFNVTHGRKSFGAVKSRIKVVEPEP